MTALIEMATWLKIQLNIQPYSFQLQNTVCSLPVNFREEENPYNNIIPFQIDYLYKC